VIEEQESFLELASSEVLLAELQKVLSTDAERWLTDLDDGIHSGMERHDTKGMFFYFTAPRDRGRAHFWRYYDLQTRKMVDNRYHILQIIACSPDTPRFPPPYSEVNVFEIQDRVIESILANVEQQAAAAIVNSPVSEEQALVAQVLQSHLHHPQVDRQELRELRRFLRQPLVGAAVQQLRKGLQTYSSTNDVQVLIETAQALYQSQGAFPSNQFSDEKPVSKIRREDLKLICYEYIYA
jgi:hypothetical protein